MAKYKNLELDFVWVCPHTLEYGWPVDGDDYFRHTHCECPKVVLWQLLDKEAENGKI